MEQARVVNVGLIGFGAIGVGVVKTFLQEQAHIDAMAGRPVRLTTVADIDLDRDRGVDTTGLRLTRDANELLEDPRIDVVIELVGGTGIAKTFVEGALRNNKHVVTANKALLAIHGADLFQLANDQGRAIMLEGAVAGGIPLMKTLEGGMAATRVQEIYGIINGTCNHILSAITHEGQDYATALADAQANNFAEADPTTDVQGLDAAHKITILASFCFGARVPFEQVYTEGITRITPEDIKHANELGYAVKLLAVAKDLGDTMEVRVHPTMIPKTHLLASVEGVYNAVCMVGPGMGTTLLYGRGAGELPTGQAVVSDVIALARDLDRPLRQGLERSFGIYDKPLLPIQEIRTAYYMRMRMIDRPGVLAELTRILGVHRISIASLVQLERWEDGDEVPLVIMTHEALEGNMQNALREICAMDGTSEEPFLIRVERL